MASWYNRTTLGGRKVPLAGYALYLIQVAYLAAFNAISFWDAKWGGNGVWQFLLFWLGGGWPLLLIVVLLGFRAVQEFNGGASGDWFVFLISALMACMFTAMPLVAYLPIAKLSVGESGEWVFFGFLAFVPLLNVMLIAIKKVHVQLLLAVFLVFIFFLWVTTITAGQLGLPTFVARAMHVHSAESLHILVQRDACKKLYATVIAGGVQSPPFACNSDPGPINATVVWNIGSRWILEFAKENGTTPKKKVYVVLPADAVLGMQ